MIMQSYLKFKVEAHKCNSLNLWEHIQRLPKGTVFLTFVFKETSSVASTASVTECLVSLLALGPENLKLFLDE